MPVSGNVFMVYFSFIVFCGISVMSQCSGKIHQKMIMTKSNTDFQAKSPGLASGSALLKDTHTCVCSLQYFWCCSQPNPEAGCSKLWSIKQLAVFHQDPVTISSVSGWKEEIWWAVISLYTGMIKWLESSGFSDLHAAQFLLVHESPPHWNMLKDGVGAVYHTYKTL